MAVSVTLRPLDSTDAGQVEAAAAIWNAACGQELAVSPRFVGYNLQPARGAIAAARLAVRDGEPVGFAAASTFPADDSVAAKELGWIDALAVIPAAQGQGIGSALLAWAEEWIAWQGCWAAALGSGLRPFAPGVPVELGSADYFGRRGYVGEVLDAPVEETTWDLAADLHSYQPPANLRKVDGVARPAQPGDEAALLDFFYREFPGRWRYEFQEHLRNGGRLSDYMVLWTAHGVDGCCALTFEDSVRPIERYYPYRLPRLWGRLGSVGVSANRRGQGYGVALVDAGLRRLHNNGVNGCVIDWTSLLDFYGRFGFTPYRRYLQLHRPL
jgi:GNAT superfamily N-acetyltransferase